SVVFFSSAVLFFFAFSCLFVIFFFLMFRLPLIFTLFPYTTLFRSVAVQVLVMERSQPVPVSAPSVKVAVRPVAQLSLTEAVPKAAVICADVGFLFIHVALPILITGASVSLVKVIVCVCVPVLPHASVAVQVLVMERSQPVPVSAPSVKVAVRPVAQLSLTEAVPKAAVICAAVGLQVTAVEAVTVITGASVSLVAVVGLDVVLHLFAAVIVGVSVVFPQLLLVPT